MENLFEVAGFQITFPVWIYRNSKPVGDIIIQDDAAQTAPVFTDEHNAQCFADRVPESAQPIRVEAPQFLAFLERIKARGATHVSFDPLGKLARRLRIRDAIPFVRKWRFED